jgi:hypothetical protein
MSPTMNVTDDDEYKLGFKCNSFDTTVDVIFRDTNDSINECQKRNYEELVNRQEQLTPEILEAIFKYYKEAYQYYHEGFSLSNSMTKKEIEKYLPTPTTPENLKKFIEPSTIYIANKKECEEGTMGISFGCTWDTEHDLGVVLKNWKVVQTGTGEIAFLF